MMLATAMILDAIFGEPDWLWSRYPHPAVVMGRAVAWMDTRLNTGANRRDKGVLAVVLLVIGAWALGSVIAWVPDFGLLEVLGAAILLAQRSLVTHVQAVAQALRDGGPPQGRAAVAMIVGRDTDDMDTPQVARAAIESAAENLSDGVIAPAFWFLILGLPGILIYKVVNTADSMIGYKTERHAQFGWAAARLDDVLNWIPARLTAALIVLAHGAPALWLRVPNDARLHRSPNAGWPEAALAPVLGVALAGPRSYEGQMQDFPWVNPTGDRTLGADHIDRAVRALWRTWGVTLALILGVWVLF